MKLLVTGGLGYVGSHFCVAALQNHYELVIVDNLVRHADEIHGEIERLGGKSCRLVRCDINDLKKMPALFEEESPIDVVIHFAAKKNSLESIQNPIKYYLNNVCGSIQLLAMMEAFGVKKLVFSSTAAVYAEGSNKPIDETMPTHPITPYGKSKQQVEEILIDYCQAHSEFSVASLRYFNAIGAHDSGRLGEQVANRKSGSIMANILLVASGQKEYLSIYGHDYPNQDGTSVRDYVHVLDLVQGHLDCLKYIESHPGFTVFNLGRGKGCSILELIKTFENENKVNIPYQFEPRRPGDFSAVFADVSKAEKEIGWHTEYNLKQAVRHDWHRFLKASES